MTLGQAHHRQLSRGGWDGGQNDDVVCACAYDCVSLGRLGCGACQQLEGREVSRGKDSKAQETEGMPHRSKVLKTREIRGVWLAQGSV